MRDGTRKDPVQAGIQQSVQNIRHGRYVRSISVVDAVRAKLVASEIADGRREGVTFDDEIGLLRSCLDRMLEGGLLLADVERIRDQVESIARVLAAKAKVEQGVRISVVDDLLPLLEELGGTMHGLAEKFIPDKEARSGFDSAVEAAIADVCRRRLSARIPAIAAAVSGE